MIYLELFWVFFKIGAFTFGGGYAMLPLVQEAVLKHGWMDGQAVVDFIAISESTPGPFAVNMATFAGMQTAGLGGAVCATLGVVLPSFLVILLIAGCLQKFRQNKLVSGAMSGLRPAVVGMIAAAILSVGKTTCSVIPLWGGAFWMTVLLFGGCLALSFRKVHPLWLILLAGGTGVAAGYFGLLG